MGRTKVKIIFESDECTPMEIIDYFHAHTEDHVPEIEITDYEALDWTGRESNQKETGP